MSFRARRIGLIFALVTLTWLVGHDFAVDAGVRDRDRAILPGEFEPVERLVIAWDDALSGFLADIMAVARDEVPITVLVDPQRTLAELDHQLGERGIGRDTHHAPYSIDVVRVPVASMWIRDFGPLVTRTQGGDRRIVDFDYPVHEAGNLAPGKLQELLWPTWKLDHVPLDLEGGNVQSDGAGRCVTATGYAGAGLGGDANQSAIGEVDLRRALRTTLGCRKLFIVPPLFAEPTAHLDMFALITGPAQVMVGSYEPSYDATNAARLDRTAEILRRGGFMVRRIPMPHRWRGAFRSYTNALALNRRILVPVYSSADSPEEASREADALAVFRVAYPGRTIVPIESSRAIEFYGAVHCATMTIPEGRSGWPAKVADLP